MALKELRIEWLAIVKTPTPRTGVDSFFMPTNLSALARPDFQSWLSAQVG
jgi:hypothetical protein